MTIERVIGRVDASTSDVDWIDLDWSDTVRRALRLASRGGRRVNVLLPRDHPTLRDGDVLAMIESIQLAIAVRPSALLHLKPSTLEAMGLFCGEAGNQHWPLEMQGAMVVALDDGPIRELAERLAVPYVSAMGPFHPARFSVPPILDRSRERAAAAR